MYDRDRRSRRVAMSAVDALRVGLVAIVLGVLCHVPLAAQPVHRVVSATDTRIVLEVDADAPVLALSPYLDGTKRLSIAGYGTFGQAGEPAVPARLLWVALPPRGDYRLSASVVATRSLGTHRLEPVPTAVPHYSDGMVTTQDVYRIDPAVYDAAGSVAGAVDAGVSRIRHQRVLAVRVMPASYDPRTGRLTLATRIRVDITLSRPSGAAGGDVTDPPVIERPEWRRILDGMLVNPGQAAEWRVKAMRRPGVDSRTDASRALAGPLVKLKITDAGVYRVRADDVIAAGLPGATPIADLHLFKRSYDDAILAPATVDVAYRVVEDPAGVAGEFDGDDVLVFYAQSIRQDDVQADAIAKFSDENVYWLGTTTGTPMVQRSPPVGFVTADTALATFAVSRSLERDLFFMEGTPPGFRDFFFYHGWFLPSFSIPFELDAIRPDRDFRVAAEFLGSERGRPTRRIDVKILNSKGTIDLGSVLVPDKQYVSWVSTPTSGGLLVEGVNTLRIDPNGLNQTTTWLEALLNRFSIVYDSPYRARGNVLVFDTGSFAGDTSITVTGLSRKDMLLLDVTDARRPVDVVLSDAHFQNAEGGGFALSFRESIAGLKRYILTPVDRIPLIPAAAIEGDIPSGLIGHVAEGGVDILVVAPENFMAETQRLVDWRRAQGYRVLMADVKEIFDEFNGGVMHPRGIRRFARHFFELGDASFMLLVGDSSEDNKNVNPNSGPNFVPTESFSEFVGAGFDEDEVVTTDKYYVMFARDIIDNPSTNPVHFLPSMMVGRIPAGTTVELQQIIDKVIAFEQPQPDDFWRRRTLRVADDAWSWGADFLSCFRSVERGFENAEASAATITEAALPGGFDVIRFFLSNRMEHPDPSTCVFATVQTNRCRLAATPVLLDEMNRGASVISFQAHMDRSQIGHEALLTMSTEADGVRDYTRIANVGKPFVVFGMGCHMSDFAIHSELNRNTPNGPTGDSFSELLLVLANRGAVATYASTGFEYLSTNVTYTDILTRTFYESPPTGPEVASGRQQARWIMGELATSAEIENLALRGASGPGVGAIGMIKRYHVLGDPALRIDGGPPRYDVTVDGNPFESGGLLFSGQTGGPIAVRAEIRDEVAMEKIRLLIDGVDASDQLTVAPLVDQTLDAARAYEATFEHEILPKTYDIELQALQAADTTGTNYYTVGNFVLRVELDAKLLVNGRRIAGDGDPVPPVADYTFELTSPVKLDPTQIAVEIDETPVPSIEVVPASPSDSTQWQVHFSANLARGAHTITIFVDNSPFEFQVTVSTQTGLRDVVAYPNPFKDATQFVFSNDVTITDGRIEVFTTSGKKVARLPIPSSAWLPGQNAVPWDGRTFDGSKVANGVYLYVIRIDQGGRETVVRDKVVRIE